MQAQLLLVCIGCNHAVKKWVVEGVSDYLTSQPYCSLMCMYVHPTCMLQAKGRLA